MSWEPVTLWALRCDGDTTRGQCPRTYHDSPDDEDDTPIQALYDTRDLTTVHGPALRAAGWLTAGPRVLCPAHLAAAAYLAAAELDGLPFEEEVTE